MGGEGIREKGSEGPRRRGHVLNCRALSGTSIGIDAEITRRPGAPGV